MYFKKIILYLTICLCVTQTVVCRRDRKKLIRKKRYVAFPEGAAFSAVYCVTSQMGITDSAAIFSEGINWGLVYELPNDTKPFLNPNGAAQKRRNRRDLYSKVENVLTSMGYNGRSCILRTLCEASRYFKVREDSLIHHIIGLVFRFPQDPIQYHEPDDHRMYHWASQIGSHAVKDENEYNDSACSDIFQCPFSLIDMALGQYSGIGNVLRKSVDND